MPGLLIHWPFILRIGCLKVKFLTSVETHLDPKFLQAGCGGPASLSEDAHVFDKHAVLHRVLRLQELCLYDLANCLVVLPIATYLAENGFWGEPC